MHLFMSIVHHPLVLVWSGYGSYSPISKAKTVLGSSIFSVNQSSISIQCKWVKQCIIPASYAMSMDGVNIINHSICDHGYHQYWSGEMRHHVAKSTRTGELSQEYKEAFPSTYSASLPYFEGWWDLQGFCQSWKVFFLKSKFGLTLCLAHVVQVKVSVLVVRQTWISRQKHVVYQHKIPTK